MFKPPFCKGLKLVVLGMWVLSEKTVSEPITGKEWAEGPTQIKVGKYTYIYWDKYRNKKYGAVRTRSLSKPQWEDVSGLIRFPAGVRHGTAFKVDDAVLLKLQNLENASEQ